MKIYWSTILPPLPTLQLSELNIILPNKPPPWINIQFCKSRSQEGLRGRFQEKNKWAQFTLIISLWIKWTSSSPHYWVAQLITLFSAILVLISLFVFVFVGVSVGGWSEFRHNDWIRFRETEWSRCDESGWCHHQRRCSFPCSFRIYATLSEIKMEIDNLSTSKGWAFPLFMSHFLWRAACIKSEINTENSLHLLGSRCLQAAIALHNICVTI